MASSQFLCSNHFFPTSRNSSLRSNYHSQFRPYRSSNFDSNLQIQRTRLFRLKAMASDTNASRKQVEVVSFILFGYYALGWSFGVVRCWINWISNGPFCFCVLLKSDRVWSWWKDEQVGWWSGQECPPFKAYFVLSLQGILSFASRYSKIVIASCIELGKPSGADKCFLENYQQEGRWVSWFGISFPCKLIVIILFCMLLYSFFLKKKYLGDDMI